jgi:peptidoglycan/xylan/chitin deacetylase (PgdA/CDA1 family)
MKPFLLGTVTACVAASVGVMGYGIRGRTSNIFGRSIVRGRTDKPEIAFTFDDGPSESTPDLLSILNRYGAKATFFQCGVHVKRLPAISREVISHGHEIGNHTYCHERLVLKSSKYIYDELARTQDLIQSVTQRRPQWFRAPYGLRWYGLRSAQRRLGLTGAMWTVMGWDWEWPAARIIDHLSPQACNGAIFCLHDGRELSRRPDISQTLEAVESLLRILSARGFRFRTVTDIAHESD